MKGSMDRVQRGGSWTRGPYFVYVRTVVRELLKTMVNERMLSIYSEKNFPLVSPRTQLIFL